MDQLSLVISVLSLFISLAAFLVAVWHNVKSFTPLLTVLQNNSRNSREISIVLENKGLGPATLTRVEFLLDGKRMKNDFSEILEILEAKDFRLEYFYQVRRLGSVLATGDKFVPIKLIFANQELPEEAIDLINRVSVRIWYRSIYGIEHRRFSQLLPE